MQILFEPENQHWVTTEYIDGEVRLYDSSFNGRLCRSLEFQICRIYANAATEGNILVTVVPVQQQIGTSICGVMAIANGYHAVCGDSIYSSTELYYKKSSYNLL